MVEQPPWEYGFYDAEFPEVIHWAAKGINFDDPDMAQKIAEDIVWEFPMIVRRRKGSYEWEHYDDWEDTSECP